MILEAFHVLGTVALGQSIQVVKKSGINDLFLEFINAGGHQIVYNQIGPGSKTFEDGEKVVKWKYCKAIF